jgi:hypothetical protein
VKKLCSFVFLVILFVLAGWSLLQLGEWLAKGPFAAIIIQAFLILIAVCFFVAIITNPPLWKKKSNRRQQQE